MGPKKKNPWYVAGLHFECVRCGRCCSGPTEGYIWVVREEIERIADYLRIPPAQLRREFLKRVGLRSSIIEHPNTKDCIFLQSRGGEKCCTIYPVRPMQCRSWPFWPSNLTGPDEWNRVAKKCGGINRGRLYSCDEIQKIRNRRKWWRECDKQER